MHGAKWHRSKCTATKLHGELSMLWIKVFGCCVSSWVKNTLYTDILVISNMYTEGLVPWDYCPAGVPCFAGDDSFISISPVPPAAGPQVLMSLAYVGVSKMSNIWYDKIWQMSQFYLTTSNNIHQDLLPSPRPYTHKHTVTSLNTLGTCNSTHQQWTKHDR